MGNHLRHHIEGSKGHQQPISLEKNHTLFVGLIIGSYGRRRHCCPSLGTVVVEVPLPIEQQKRPVAEDEPRKRMPFETVVNVFSDHEMFAICIHGSSFSERSSLASLEETINNYMQTNVSVLKYFLQDDKIGSRIYWKIEKHNKRLTYIKIGVCKDASVRHLFLHKVFCFF